ncbi:YfgM family protein [Novipirellula artificiosorum]|uniref:Tetratricopeptide repeat protein n=1 Tax=Novipirellula artificiosorum TaxID=2528016 RepID=A0A5C6DN20_9BACT|nr:hypothetical protein [Novipirellula artificiosorum]TWU37051.1 hypothetical protein Poly41_31770 [Novipirellula artificiosorum]
MSKQPFSKITITALSLASLLVNASSVRAQSDRVYPLTGSAIIGAVAKTDAQGIQVKRGSNTTNLLAGEIRKILFEGDPSALTKGREFALDGQHEEALKELNGIDLDSLPREVIKADTEFYKAFSQSQLALAGRGDKKAAAAAMLGFASKHRDSWHFYEAAKVVGDLALSLGNTKDALKFYGALSRAPAVPTQIESVYWTGMTHLAANDIAAANTEFDKILVLKVDSVAAARLQSLAKAGKATALAKSDQADEGLDLISGLVADMSSSDVEMAARVYNSQGAIYEAKGDIEGAILAYLHTHLMFSSQSDAHAIALSKLVELWPKVGKPQRAAEARDELKQRYPGFGS